MRMKMFIVCISLMCVLLSSCAIPSSNGNYFELDDYDKLTSFSAHKGEVYYIDYSFVVKKGYVDLIVYNKKTRDIVFTTSNKKKAKYQGSFKIQRSGIYIVEMDGYKASVNINSKLIMKQLQKKNQLLNTWMMLLTNTKNHDFENREMER
ncbi:hypothetical protein BED47_04015 [Gottfriedia luciferensis]|uniref:Lipoprotein n=1 Tax=Gottfriedia luciferensis TaxID=178774 RepID=A0ABX2ZYK0_9BACI|nr:hypothetical protein [Gottfriedia luciferensis]ODG93459.1 hypothetical protein BED47_04015 [Gottfriedia luciferensis]